MIISYNPLIFCYYNLLSAFFFVILPVINIRLTGVSYPIILLFLFNIIQENANIPSGISLLLQDLLKMDISRPKNSSSKSSGTLRFKLSSLLPVKISIFREQCAEY